MYEKYRGYNLLLKLIYKNSNNIYKDIEIFSDDFSLNVDSRETNMKIKSMDNIILTSFIITSMCYYTNIFINIEIHESGYDRNIRYNTKKPHNNIYYKRLYKFNVYKLRNEGFLKI